MNFIQTHAPVLAQHFTSLASGIAVANSTGAAWPGASLSSKDPLEIQHDLYGGVDIADLNWLERSWAAWYIWIGNPVIATGVMSFLMHEVSFNARR